jgi:IS30 family transposase
MKDNLFIIYNGMNFSVRHIAKFLKRHASTISRELRRHTKRRYYSPSFSQRKYELNRKNCGRPSLLVNSNLGKTIEYLFLQNQCSPEQIVHRLKHKGFESIVSINTIYRSIYKRLFNSTISPNSKGAMMKLRHKNKRRKTKDYIEKRGQFPISHTIHDRPNEAELGSEIGHWEVNPVDSSAIQTFVEAENAAKIPVIALDRSADGGQILTLVASDNVKGNEMAIDDRLWFMMKTTTL